MFDLINPAYVVNLIRKDRGLETINEENLKELFDFYEDCGLPFPLDDIIAFRTSFTEYTESEYEEQYSKPYNPEDVPGFSTIYNGKILCENY
jgi:hypothetical protein